MLLCRWLVVFTLCLIPTVVGAVGNNFYIAPWGNDSRDCRSRDDPCQHLSRGFAAMSGGDTLILRGGDYNDGGLNGGVPPSGPNPSQRTIITGQPGETPILHQGISWATWAESPLHIYNAQIGPNLIFDGAGISFNGANVQNVRFIGLEIRNLFDESAGGCIVFHDGGFDNPQGWPSGLEFIDNHIHHCGTKGGQHGVYACAPGTIWRGNHMHHNAAYSMQWYSSAPLGTEHCADNSEIYNNYFHESQQGQFLSGDCHDCASEVTLNHGNNIKFYNNVIVGVGQFGGGVELGRGSTNGHIYNNTIITPSGNSAVGLGNVNGVIIRNNIMYGSSNPIGTRGDTFNVTEDHNSGQNPRFQPCGVANNPADAYCIAGDSPMRDNGQDLSGQGFNTDYLGRPRNQGGKWDIGAYEYGDSQPPTCPPNCPVTCPPTCPTLDTYYVSLSGSDSTGTGDINSPFRTIAKGMSLLGPGKTLYLRGGTYAERITIDGTHDMASGTGWASNQVVKIASYPGEVATLQISAGITGELLSLSSYGMNHDIQYIIFERLVLDGTGSYQIVNISGNYNGSGCESTCKELHHILFDQMVVKNAEGCSGGFHTPGPAGTGNGQNVSMLAFPHHIEWRHSKISHSWCGYGFYVQGRDHIFDGNEIFDNAGYGIQIYDVAAGHDTPNIIVKNNIVRSNGFVRVGTDGSAGAIVHANSSQGSQYYNNLIVGNTSGLTIQTGSHGTLVYNNTIADNTGGGLIIGYAPGDPTSNITVKNNIVYGNGSNITVNSPGGYVENANLETSPHFVGTGANPYSLQADSAAINQGEPLSLVMTDFLGVARPFPVGGAWDIGAYEFTDSPPIQPPGPGILKVFAGNGRYFANQANEVVYLTGAYSWNFASDMPDSERAAYLNYVVAHNQNFIRVPSQDYNGTAQSTDYLTKLSARIGEAKAKGIYTLVSIFPFTSSPFNNNTFNQAYARSVVAAVGAHDNVIFEVGNELYTGDLDAGTPGSFMANMVSVINNEQSVQGFTPKRMVGISDFRLTSDYAQSSAMMTFMLTSQAEFIAPAWSENGGNNCDLPDYGGQKVVISESDHLFPYHCDHTWAWKALTRGLNPALLEGNSFFPDHSEPDNPADTVGAAMTFDAKERMGDTRTYALKLHLDQAVPHPELASTGYALAWPGKEYLVYQPGTGSFTVNVTAGDYTVEWFDPTARVTSPGQAVTLAAGTNTFSTPLNTGHDAVLFLKSGTTPVVGTMNPIYVAQTGGTATTDCIAAENMATPIRTIAGGLACMNTSPGKIMYVKAGTYVECIDTLRQPIKGGNGPGYTDATVIQSFQNDLVTIQPTSCPLSEGVAVFLRNGANDKFIVFRGSDPATGGNRLVLDGSNTPNNVALYPSGDHIRFEFVDIKGSHDYEAMFAYNVSNIELVDSIVRGGVSDGIAFVGTVTNMLVEKTAIHSNGGSGINTQGATLTGPTVRRANIHDNVTDGLVISTSTGASLFNSLVVDNGGKGVWILSGASGTKLHSNTLYSNTGVGVQCDAGAGVPVGVDIMNNIFTGNAAPNFVNNCSATTLSNTLTATFVAPPTDLRLVNGDPAINAGTNELSLLEDYAGLPRQQDTQDIGAHERTQPPPTGPDVTLYRVAPYQALMLF